MNLWPRHLLATGGITGSHTLNSCSFLKGFPSLGKTSPFSNLFSEQTHILKVEPTNS